MLTRFILSAVAVSSFLSVAGATVVPNPLFSSGAVLQRDMPVPVWGAANEGEKVTVTFGGLTISTVAKGGQWMVRLPPMPANPVPQKLTIAGENTVTADNVLVGEVWLCSGQSNMAFQLRRATGGAAAIAQSAQPAIHLLHVAPARDLTPLNTFKGRWEECGPGTVGDFSAVAYYFGRSLQKGLTVPIGLIGSYVGGTPAKAWTSRVALDALGSKSSSGEKQPNPALREEGDPGAAPGDTAKLGKRPTVLFNAMIAPLQPFALRGVIWYQGEADRGDSKFYRWLFPAMIADWRKGWGQGDFPFLFVQLPGFKSINPEIREAQLISWKNTSRSAMVVTIDCGEADNLHPPNKEPVGERLALAARAIAFGAKVEYSGPVFEKMAAQANQAVLSFSHVGGGLAAKDGALKGFEVAGADRNFVPAGARIDGATVIVSSPQVAVPTAVRYAWANVPDGNLFNKDGLPASPFRTDAD